MYFIRVIFLLASFFLLGFVTNAHAETPMFNKHLVKLLGTWKSSHEIVVFKANRTCVYKGRKYICAIAEGAIQIKKKKAVVVLPYRFQNGQLLITDHGNVATYTRMPKP